jgi:hypothetical protein
MEQLALPGLMLGSARMITASGNIVPWHVADLYRAFRSGLLSETHRLHDALDDIFDAAVCVEASPAAAVKCLLRRAGRIPTNEHRLPSLPPFERTFTADHPAVYDVRPHPIATASRFSGVRRTIRLVAEGNRVEVGTMLSQVALGLRVLSRRRRLERSCRWSRERLQSHQRRCVEPCDALPTSVRSFTVAFTRRPFEELPILTKSALMENFDDVVTECALRLADLDAFLHGPAQCTLFRNKYVVLATSDSSGQRGCSYSAARSGFSRSHLFRDRWPGPV